MKRFRALHVLYNNAGVLWKDKDRSVLETKETDWDRVQAINLKGPFFVMKHGIPHLIRSGGGSIVNVGSVAGRLRSRSRRRDYTAPRWKGFRPSIPPVAASAHQGD